MDSPRFQHALKTLLRQPNADQMLKRSKPIDRSQENVMRVTGGLVQKINWIGALPSSIRDRNLHLNCNVSLKLPQNDFHKQQQHTKVKRILKKQEPELPLHLNLAPQPLNATFSTTNNSFLHFPKVPEEVFQNQSGPGLESLYSPKTPNGGKRFFSANPARSTHITFQGKSSLREDNSEKSKSFSIKYIGVHNDVIGVLSRKVIVGPFPDKEKPKERVKPSEKIDNIEMSKTSICFSSPTHKKKSLTNEETSNDGEIPKNKLDETFIEQRRLSEIKENVEIENKDKSTLNQDKFGRYQEIEKTNDQMIQNPEANQLSYQFSSANASREYESHILAPKSPYKITLKKDPRPQTTNVSRPKSCFTGSHSYHIQKSDTVGVAINSIVTNNSPEKEKEISTNNQPKDKINQAIKLINIQKPSKEEQPKVADTTIPDPEKYDKFIVNKYSIQHKLTALKKRREESPYYLKKQFFVSLANY